MTIYYFDTADIIDESIQLKHYDERVYETDIFSAMLNNMNQMSVTHEYY